MFSNHEFAACKTCYLFFNFFAGSQYCFYSATLNLDDYVVLTVMQGTVEGLSSLSSISVFLMQHWFQFLSSPPRVSFNAFNEN